MAWSRVNPKDITMTTLSSLGAGPPEEEEEEDCGWGGWKGAVKSKRGEENGKTVIYILEWWMSSGDVPGSPMCSRTQFMAGSTPEGEFIMVVCG